MDIQAYAFILIFTITMTNRHAVIKLAFRSFYKVSENAQMRRLIAIAIETFKSNKLVFCI